MTKHTSESPKESMINTYTPQDLYNELNRIANINQDFRNGIVGATSFTTYQSEVIYLSNLMDPECDGKWPTPHVSEEYEFLASRPPMPNHERITRFTYSFKNTLHGIMMPQYIAEDVYGLEGKEAVENAGVSELEHTVRVQIDNRNLNLNVCESFTYNDEEGDAVLDTCSCPGDRSTSYSSIVSKRITQIDPEDADGDSHLNFGFKNHVQFDSDAARRLEVVNSIEPYEQVLLSKLGRNIEHNKVLDDMITARHVLASMKVALRKQLRLRL